MSGFEVVETNLSELAGARLIEILDEDAVILVVHVENTTVGVVVDKAPGNYVVCINYVAIRCCDLVTAT